MRGNVDQAWANRKKVIRSAVRLKYSVLADNELNWRLESEYKKFYKAVQDGKLLAPLDPKKALECETA